MKQVLFWIVVLIAAARAGWATPVTGRVTSAESGRALADVRVVVVETGTATVTDASGVFAVEAPAEGRFHLVLSAAGYRVLRLSVSAPVAEPVQATLVPIATFRDGIEVTASRARAGQDPATVTNIPARDVADAHWGQDPAMLLAGIVPGLFAYNDSGNGIGYSYFTVRGFGQARTRVTLNGAPLNDAESHELFFIDLADFLATGGDIQVRRGVFGLSGIGGAVDITTARPPAQPAFTLHGGVGSFGTRRASARFSSGLLGHRWALDVRYSKISSDGYRDQSWVDMWNYYVTLARLGERSSVRFVLFGGPERTHLAYEGVSRAVLDGALTGDRDRDRRFNPLTYPGEIDTFTQPHYQVVHELAIAEHTTFDQTIYAFRGEGHYEQFRADRALVEYGLPEFVLPDGSVVTRSDLVRRRAVDEWDYGWLPTLRHEAGPLAVTLRGEARLHRAHHWGEVRWAEFYPPGVPPDHRYYDYEVRKRTGTAAVEITWAAGNAATLQAGLQYAHHDYTMAEDALRGVAFTDNFDFVLPRAGIVVRLSDTAEAYAHIARGMREPTLRTLYDPQDYYAARAYLAPEDVWNWELGAAFRATRWRGRANLYVMDFANEIVYAGAIDDNGVPVYGNGARSRHRGLELEASFGAPTGLFGVDMGVTLSRNDFTEYREFGWEGSTTVFDGNAIAGYPDLIALLTARYRRGPIWLLASARHVGRFYLDNTEDNRRNPELKEQAGYEARINPSFTVVDVAVFLALPRSLGDGIGVAGADVELRLNNLLDARYTAFGYVDNGEPRFIPAAGRTLYAGLTIDL